MLIEFTYQEEKNWPPLAWLAVCCQNNGSIIVRHGSDVDTQTNWFCEACWNGDYANGDFDLTNVVFGSGARYRGDRVNFVSSGFTSDRLHNIELNNTCYISNSLGCLAAFLDLHVDPWYPWYYEDFSSIGDGLEEYKSSIDTDQGEVKLTYYSNLLWDGKQLNEIIKPVKREHFNDFSSYHEFLSTTLVHLAHNLRSTARPFTYEPISTSSSGYDSLAVSVLSKAMNNQEVICVLEDRIGRDDSGVSLIQQLGMKPLPVERDEWRTKPLGEVPFIAADGCGRDSWLNGTGDSLRRRLLLTGNFGGWPWAIPVRPSTNNFTSGPPPGLSMSEFRLKTGFLHCPVPCLGVEHIDAIHVISNSEEMQPWSIDGRYNRPIPRRIIEQAGLARGSFANRKTATNVHLFRKLEFDRFMAGTPSFRSYMKWIRKQSRIIPPPVEFPPLTVPSREHIEVPLFRHLFPWAFELWKQNYEPSQNGVNS